MKFILTLSVAFTIASLSSRAAGDPVLELVKRINPAHAGKIFTLNDASQRANRHFEIINDHGAIYLKGKTALDQASAYGWYLKHVNNSSLSWGGDHLEASLKLPTQTLSKDSPYRYRFAYNYCTLSYTMGFWGWQRWEREIDFLALNGYTHALVTAGVEKVWQKTLRDLNYPEDEIKKFIPNPGFAAWWNMGNLEGHGGPLTQNLIDGEAKLGRQITSRMRQLGIAPTLPGFVGLLPHNIGKYQPDLSLVPQGKWMGFTRPIVLDPTSEAYQKIAAIWYKNLHEVYGFTPKSYAGDLFHEGGKHGNINVTAAAKSVQRAMQKASPDSTWVLQSWQNNPTAALVKGTDPKKTIILQLCRNMKDGNNGGKIRSYQNRPWLWSELANFGGNHGLYGGNKLVAGLPSFLLDPAKNRGDMAGLALLSEGIETNPLYYGIFHDSFWRDKDIELDSWITAYSKRRYGTPNISATKALKILNQSVYSPKGIQEGPTESILCAKPKRNAIKASSWGSGNLYYDPKDVIKAAELLLNASPQLKGEATYRYDLTDTTRQMLANLARPVLAQTMDDYDCGDIPAFKKSTKLFLDIIRDTDELLSADEHWLLGTWIESARDKGKTAAEKMLMEVASRKQITIWSHRPDSLDDYAHRQWGGLMRDYYLPRWQSFFDLHLDILEERKSPQSLNTFYRDLRANRDVAFSQETKKYPTTVTGDTTKIAARIINRYSPIATKLWNNQPKQIGIAWTLGTKKELSWDVSGVFLSKGTYKCSILWKRGTSALKISSLTLYQGDKIVAEDIHPGWAGMSNKRNVYIINLEELREGLDTYTLRAKVSGASGVDSHGVINIKKIK